MPGRKMHIAMISTPFVPVPPRDYGGTELIVYELVEGLLGRGHDVTLFATGDSRTRAPLRARYRRALWPPETFTELNHASWAMREVAEGRVRPGSCPLRDRPRSRALGPRSTAGLHPPSRAGACALPVLPRFLRGGVCRHFGGPVPPRDRRGPVRRDPPRTRPLALSLRRALRAVRLLRRAPGQGEGASHRDRRGGAGRSADQGRRRRPPAGS